MYRRMGCTQELKRKHKTIALHFTLWFTTFLLAACGSGGQDGEAQVLWERTNIDKFFRTDTGVQVDQKWEPPPPGCVPSEGDVHQILHFQPTGQEFTPTQSSLAAVEVWLTTISPPGEDTISVKIREATIAGPILATASTIVGQIDNWKRFDLPSAVEVTPGAIHVIDVSATNQSHGWKGGRCAQGGFEDYPGGAWVHKVEQ